MLKDQPSCREKRNLKLILILDIRFNSEAFRVAESSVEPTTNQNFSEHVDLVVFYRDAVILVEFLLLAAYQP